MNAEQRRRYGSVPSTQGGILSELIGEQESTSQPAESSGSAESTAPDVDSGDQERGVPVPEPPRPARPREKRTVYLTPELAEAYDRALIEMHGQHRVVKGAVQDAILAVGLLHRGEVEQVLRGER